MSTSLLCEKAHQITNAKAYVFSDSVLWVGKMGEDPIATWKSKIKWHPENNHFKDMDRIDGMPTEFEWKIFPGITTLGLLEKIQSPMRDLQCKPEHFKDRIIFVQRHCMERKRKYRKIWIQFTDSFARKFPRGHWSFLEPGAEKKWYGTYTDKPDESWDRMAEEMMLNFSDSDHPIFRAFSAFERGELRSKGGRTKSIHFNGSDENIELLLRTEISANRLSVYGAIADLLPKDLWAPGKPVAPDHLETMEIPTRPSAEETWTNAQQRRNLVQEYEKKFEQLSEDRCNIYAENTRCLEMKRRPV